MQNKPNFRKAKMVVTAVYTMTNNNEQRTMNYSKQTQFIPTEGGSNPRELKVSACTLGGTFFLCSMRSLIVQGEFCRIIDAGERKLCFVNV